VLVVFWKVSDDFFFLDLSSVATMDIVVNRPSRLIDDSLTFYINQFFLSNQNSFSQKN
jgi:hypothetical protein